jgi:hypothetical protein
MRSTVRNIRFRTSAAVIITTNHKSDGIFLPADDRRHFVAWSDLDKSDFTDDYWKEFWQWYGQGGLDVVAHYLANLDLTAFNPKAPPPKTEAFHEIVNASRTPEDAELADALDELGWPNVVTIKRPSSWRASRVILSITSRTGRTAARSRTGSRPVDIRRSGIRMPRTAYGA